MKTEEEVETWYEEEKRKLLEKFLAALEKKEKDGREKAEQLYKNDLNTLFEKYKKFKLGIIRSESDRAIAAAAKRAKAKFSLARLIGLVKR